MTTVLLVNHKQPACGVYQFGKRIYDLVKDSENVIYYYTEVDELASYCSAVNFYKPDIIVYNWHRGTMPWLTEKMIIGDTSYKHYFIFHEEFVRKNYDKYLFLGAYDFTNGEKFGDKKVLLPRPLLEYNGTYSKNKVLTVGSFGFGFWQKGFHELTSVINHSFDKAVLNLHMPYSFFGDPLKEQTNAVELECWNRVSNSGFTLNITHELLDDDGVLKFLAGNDINMFLYGENGEGISSVIDYALSVKRPIAISNSKMFRHLDNSEILYSENSIVDIINKGTKPLEKYYKDWSIENFRKEFDKVFL